MNYGLKSALLGIFVFGMILACILAGTGCATTQLSVEDRAAKHGTVLECKKTLVYQNGRQVTRCLVSTPEGDKFFYFKE